MLDAVRPYLALIKAGVAVLLLVTSFLVGCQVQRDRDARAMAEKDAVIAQLTTAGELAAAAIDEINREAERRVREHEATLQAIGLAGDIAAQALADMKR